MVTQFSAPASSGSSSSGSGTTIILILLVGAALFAGYHFFVKPMLEKDESKE